MIRFLLWAGLLLAAAYALFVPVLRGKRNAASPRRDQLQQVMYRQRLQELQQELAQGALQQAEYDNLVLELDSRWLSETAGTETVSGAAAPSRWPVAVVLVALPFLAIGLYGYLGRPDLLEARTTAAAAPDMKSIEENIQRLAQRMEASPDDLQGWMLLARSYQVLHRPEPAARAYERAMALAPDNLDIKALYAEALAENQANRLEGRPAEIVAEIIKKDANHPTGLWLAGLIAAEKGDAQQALAYWSKLKAQYPADSEDAKQLSGYMAMLGGQPGAEPAAAAKPSRSVKLRVSLAPALAARAQPNDTLFVFAKAASGPPMPLAIVRKQVKDLPLEVTLDDSMAMAQGMNLSAFPQIVLGARVSKSGQAMPASGDLQGFSPALAPAADQTYAVQIDQVVP